MKVECIEIYMYFGAKLLQLESSDIIHVQVLVYSYQNSEPSWVQVIVKLIFTIHFLSYKYWSNYKCSIDGTFAQVTYFVGLYRWFCHMPNLIQMIYLHTCLHACLHQFRLLNICYSKKKNYLHYKAHVLIS